MQPHPLPAPDGLHQAPDLLVAPHRQGTLPVAPQAARLAQVPHHARHDRVHELWQVLLQGAVARGQRHAGNNALRAP
jgi:hypothetical protein